MRETVTGWCRIAFAAGVAAVMAIELTWQFQQPGFKVGNYFSFFTIQSNLVGAFALALTGASLLRGGPRFDRLRGAATVYLATTGIVFVTMLSNVQFDQFVPQLSNTYFHKIMPIVILLDWLLDPPRTTTFEPRVLLWLLYPLAYLAYSLMRGPFADWYPYPFIDPADGGWGHVAAGAATVALIILGLSLLLSWAGDRLWSRRRLLQRPLTRA